MQRCRFGRLPFSYTYTYIMIIFFSYKDVFWRRNLHLCTLPGQNRFQVCTWSALGSARLHSGLHLILSGIDLVLHMLQMWGKVGVELER